MLRFIKVRGESLSPEYVDGDYVLAWRLPLWLGRLRPGDAVVFQQPGYGLLIKKVASISPDGSRLEVLGAHPDSVDSRRFGPIEKRSIAAVVFAHIRKPRS
jgi:hypothetical protein